MLILGRSNSPKWGAALAANFGMKFAGGVMRNLKVNFIKARISTCTAMTPAEWGTQASKLAFNIKSKLVIELMIKHSLKRVGKQLRRHYTSSKAKASLKINKNNGIAIIIRHSRPINSVNPSWFWFQCLSRRF